MKKDFSLFATMLLLFSFPCFYAQFGTAAGLESCAGFTPVADAGRIP